ncbi:hypothetical protein HPB50_029378 [Hyalomma asiaticum]|nr:hypothetical protein HPB50_029378 [Hyalomma asiaticum]
MSDLKGTEARHPAEAEEARSTGSVKGRVYWSYMTAGAGPLLMPLLFVSSIFAQAIFNGSDFWLTYWYEYFLSYSRGVAGVLVTFEDTKRGEWHAVIDCS